MARPRLQQSTADYIAIAISPVLIMLLVGSLVFFLQEISYEGQYQGRVRWMLGWFVIATVLISQIGIEFGKAHASLYAGALGLACTAFAFRFLDDYIVGTMILMGVIWWCVNKLTWDCTLIDDSVEVTSSGLLEQSGMNQPPVDIENDKPPETEKLIRRQLRREALQSTTENSPDSPHEPDPTELITSKKQQAPGVWVVYFSLAALPLFGIGQAFLPQSGESIREGFVFLWVYVASALGLFLTTSFLGLRRYLRQRGIKMPAKIAFSWIGTGLMIMLVVLGASMLIPRPHAESSVIAFLDSFVDDQSASDAAVASDDAGEGEGRRAGKAEQDVDSPEGKQGEEGDPADTEGEGDQRGNSEKEGDSEENKQQSDQQQGDKKQTDNNDQRNDEQQNEPQNDQEQQANREEPEQESESPQSESPSTPSSPSQLADLLKWIIFIGFGLLTLWALWKNRHDLIAGARELFQSLILFWSNLFSPRKQKGADTDQANLDQEHLAIPLKSFAEYENPFATGLAHRMSSDALVLYTQQALRAFGREQGIPDGEEITAIEFGNEVALRHPELSNSLRFLTTAYSRILYSSRPPKSFDITPLETLWAGMSHREPHSVG